MVVRGKDIIKYPALYKKLLGKLAGPQNTIGFGVFNCTFSDKFDGFIHILIIEFTGESI